VRRVSGTAPRSGVVVITIECEFGAGGRSVGRIIARLLGARLIEGELAGDVAGRLGIGEAEVDGSAGRAEPLVDRLFASMQSLAPGMLPPWQPPGHEGAMGPRNAIVQSMQAAVRDAARAGDAVIVGRGGAFLLRNESSARHVFLHAAEDLRLHVIMSRFRLDARAGLARLRAVDAARAASIRQLYRADWRDPANYDLVLNTGRLGHDRAARVVVAMSKFSGRQRDADDPA